MRAFVLLLLSGFLCSCSNTRSSEPTSPPAAHVVASNGVPVAGAPEPEVVQLRNIETVEKEKHITIGNVAGDYVLVCDEDANGENFGIKSCLSPLPQRNYLLFRADTKWLINGAKEPMNLGFMQNWSVSYERGENIGLLPISMGSDPTNQFGVYWLASWSAKKAK